MAAPKWFRGKGLTVKQRVANGARWLDENFPGWEKRINLTTLALASGQHCICGQVFEKKATRDPGAYAGFDWAQSHLFSEANSWITTIVDMEPVSRRAYANDDKPERIERVGIALGFVKTHGQTWDSLQDEWVKLLKGREAARQAAATVA